ncbi:UNVERIFIED_ORG: type 1 fimbria pilin [Buttiauxella agrestis ATCC 33320]
MRLFISFVFIIVPFFTFADTCYFISGSTVNTMVNMPGVITVGRDTVPGTILWDSKDVNESVHPTVECTGTTHRVVEYVNPTTPASGFDKVYQTTVHGVGIKVLFSNSQSISPNTAVPLSEDDGSNPEGNDYYPIARYRVQLIAISNPIASGTIVYPSPYIRQKYDSIVSNTMTFSATNVVLKSTGCEIKTSQVIVPMGDYFVTDFTGIGSTSKAVTIPPISLICDADTHVKATIVADADPSLNGAIKLSSGSQSASGIGIQVLNENYLPVNVNTKVEALNTVSAGNYTINWRARYIQTKNKITAGQADAIATLAITYE